MFDVFQVIDLQKNKRQNKFLKSFSNIPSYSDIRYKENVINSEHSCISYLERDNNENNYFLDGSTHYFIYGSAYTNNKYSKLKNEKNKKLSVKDLCQLYKTYANDTVSYIKGSFVVLIYNDDSPSLKIFTDRLNVLPLYYAMKDGLFFISSSVSLLKSVELINLELDNVALASQMIFDYVTETRTFYKNIKQTDSAHIYDISKVGIKIEEYWTVEELYHEKLLAKKESLELMSEQLFNNVQLYADVPGKLLIALTGGFDGRTNLAMLRKNPNKFSCYSYGMKGSNQITIPQEVAKKTGIEYNPLYLEKEFLDNYQENAKHVIEFSNGTAPIMRTNYPYAYQKLRDYSNTILTGLFGSEVLRPIHGLGIFTNDMVINLLITNNYDGAKQEIFDHLKSLNYIDEKVLLDGFEEAISIIERYRTKYAKYGKLYPYFFYLIKEGVRKYFMQEIQIERVYVTTLFPYWDDDFIDLIYRTQFAGMYNGLLKNSKVKRRKGQLLYAHIIKKYQPELGKIILDRGYTPNDLIKPFPLNYLFLLRGVLKAKKYKKKHGGIDTYNSKLWTEETIRNSLQKAGKNKLFCNGLVESFENGKYKNDMLRYSHMISLLNYLEN